MAKTLWIRFALIFFLVSMVASKKGGKSKGGGWSSGSNRNPSYPGNTGSNWNPGHAGNTGGNWNPHPANPGGHWNTGGNWGNNYNPGGSNYNKQFKPPKTKTNMKMVAAGAAAGAIGGFMLGNAVSNMRYHFDNDNDYRYYNNYQSRMPDRVYRPVYQDNAYVTEDRFVTDCYNTSMTEYIVKPNEGKNETEVDQTEVRIKSTVIRQLCVTEYRRGPQFQSGSGFNLLISPILILIITLFEYFVVE